MQERNWAGTQVRDVVFDNTGFLPNRSAALLLYPFACVKLRAMDAGIPSGILIANSRVDPAQLRELVEQYFGDMVKLVVDVRRRVVALGGELHADAEALLLEHGSRQTDLWGANYYPGLGRSQCIEFTALINIRPAQGNRSMQIQDPGIREAVREIVHELVGTGEPL